MPHQGKSFRVTPDSARCAHGPSAPIQMRILSATNREGLSSKKSTKPLSFDLLLHCDGGGYVARSSKSHETYLRLWAKYLDCSIVSVDYSLAPKFPFPRPIEEVLYAYAWIVKNPEKFGWDGKKLLRVGDSSGGNLIVSVALHLAQLKAARMPDGPITICTPFLFQCFPSSSRVLSFTDPLLHMEIVILCADAYTGFCPNGTVLGITSRNSFDGLVVLNNLKLQVNQLTTIDAGVFDGMPKPSDSDPAQLVLRLLARIDVDRLGKQSN
ncbi:hypothetical protein M3Y96_00886100 [Aphelenchoides besseyi]|nr:hypothetical protein M3Y96_00886100 [Aphelenchoides besseyi]